MAKLKSEREKTGCASILDEKNLISYLTGIV